MLRHEKPTLPGGGYEGTENDKDKRVERVRQDGWSGSLPEEWLGVAPTWKRGQNFFKEPAQAHRYENTQNV